MSKITSMPGTCHSLDVLMAIVRDQYPDAKTGIIIVFDGEGNMHTHWHCNAQEQAMAAARLCYLAGRDEE